MAYGLKASSCNPLICTKADIGSSILFEGDYVTNGDLCHLPGIPSGVS